MADKVAPKQVQILKLSSGEEIIGQVTDLVVEERQIIVMEKPAVIVLQPTDNEGKFSIGLAPYVPYAVDNTIHLMPNHVIGVMQPTQQLLDEYNTHYGSSLITPKKKEIIT